MALDSRHSFKCKLAVAGLLRKMTDRVVVMFLRSKDSHSCEAGAPKSFLMPSWGWRRGGKEVASERDLGTTSRCRL